MATAESTTTKIAGPQKAAILLVALGDKVGGELMKQLNEEEVKAVSKAIARLEKVTPSQTESVLEEFAQLAGHAGGRGGFEYAKRVLANAFGPEGAKRIAEHLPKSGVRMNKNLESLQKADPNQLSRFIAGEHPQTIALILSHLSAVASRVSAGESAYAAALGCDAANRSTGPGVAGRRGARLGRDQRKAENTGRSEDGTARRSAVGGRNFESHGRKHERGNPGQLAG